MGNYPGKSMEVSGKEMDSLRSYLAAEGKRFGNSRQFKEVVQAFEAFTNAARQGFGPEQEKQYAAAAENLKRACEAYTSDRGGAHTARGKERLDAVGRIASSMSFWEVERSLGNLESAMDKPIDQKQAEYLVRSSDHLKKACDTYMKGIGTSHGLTHLGQVEEIERNRQARTVGIDQLRDISNVAAYSGRSWNAMGSIRTNPVKMAENAQKTGANVSERFQATYNGKRGFFTAVNQISLERTDYIDQMIEQERVAGNIQNAASLWAARGSLYGVVKQGDYWQKQSMTGEESAQITAMSNALLQYWYQLPDGPEKKALSGITENMDHVKNFMDEYSKQMKKADPKNPDAYQNAISHAAEDIFKEKPHLIEPAKAVAVPLKEYLDQVKVPTMEEHPTLRGHNLLMVESAKMYGNPERAKEVQALDRIIKDPAAVALTAAASEKAAAAALANEVGFLKKDDTDMKAGMEVTLRSVGMTRIADMLGIGNIIARSEKVSVSVDGKEVEGCFMEFAEGVDLYSRDPEVREKIRSVEFSETPALLRDMSRVEVLDFICGQNDRHHGNMFYKLSEPDINGKRNIIGIQGIDNDLAFGGVQNDMSLKNQGGLNDLTFIEEDLAKAVKNLDREKLQYALGDILSEKQIEHMALRVEGLQERLNKNLMIEVKPDGWALDEYKLEDFPEMKKVAIIDRQGVMDKMLKEGYSQRQVSYLAGLRTLDSSATGKYPWERCHKNAEIRGGLKLFNQTYERDMKLQEKNAEPVKKEPEKAAEPVKKQPEKAAEAVQKQPEKAAEAVQKQPEKAPEKAPAQGRQRMSFLDLEKGERPRERKAAIGARKPAAPNLEQNKTVQREHNK